MAASPYGSTRARLVLTSLSALSVAEVTGGSAKLPARLTVEESPRSVEPTRADFEAVPDDSAAAGKDLLRRYQEPYPTFWHHGGLNE